MYNDEPWFICPFTGLAIRGNDYKQGEDNIINAQLYFIDGIEHNIFIGEYGISFEEDSEGFIIATTKKNKKTKKICISEVYDKKYVNTYTMKDKNLLIKN